ncbi:MAG TPA: CcmD family protein [Niabella sp.]|nr:CcmD family protein [Niabella sp.]HQW14953.1 CcmD family protein [Niabella sp.]HQX20155.1 CcmD family protein [Niabella sp.]HQX41911.1 CcmD family protein [Niabella sp.]HRB06760.1 CcmD family protein [Niabella sp.]
MKFLMMLLMLVPILANAQSENKLMYSNGRIYVVIAVMLIILLGIVLYLVRIERKLKKLEDSNR